ncbi:hypothetical protein A1E_04665 [Rickettsia canadensis str. McKiel]|uniref:Uncharacterized protein n=1 Tax=Rickettsia canadensis (strain McKiel) TaxID=293613 RepID=A8EZS5_RICCK|nr:hypothetical protein [Rickettsia canadensis]ABV73858.1 hypothetical protein A1E_04665 [Rickettsia canadensis str. McKiel]
MEYIFNQNLVDQTDIATIRKYQEALALLEQVYDMNKLIFTQK